MKIDNRRTISKKNAAIIQLRDAVHLYYNRSYISAITLAAAAEEILGKLSDETYSQRIGRRAKHNFADSNAILTARFVPSNFDTTDCTDDQKEKLYQEIERQYISNRNRIRNELKHKNEHKEEIKFFNFKQTAEEHIVGAIVNYKLFENELPNDEIIIRFSKDKGIN